MEMEGKQVIATYESILNITGQMLLAAQNSQWDKLICLEQECKSLTKKLVANKTDKKLSKELQKKKIDIIHKVLKHDAQIREITEPWMLRLQNILNTAGRKRNLQQAYQTGSSA
jgi:flagellar protein FliT